MRLRTDEEDRECGEGQVEKLDTSFSVDLDTRKAVASSEPELFG